MLVNPTCRSFRPGQLRITFETKPLPFPEEVDGAPLARVLSDLRRTPLAEGVADTMQRFRELVASGKMKKDEMLK